MLFPLHDDNPTVRPPVVTVGLIVVNALAWLWLLHFPEPDRDLAIIRHGFVPKRIEQLSNPKLIVSVPVEIEQRDALGRDLVVRRAVELPPVHRQVYASIITSMFLHASWMHILGNMWFLWLFGNNVEDRLGHVLFTIFYLVGGLLATACHWLFGPTSVLPSVGASGAIAAVLGGYAVTFPWARVHTVIFVGLITTVELPAMVVLGIWFLFQLISSALNIGEGGGVAWWAHIGGFAAGMVLMPMFAAIAPRAPGHWHEEFKDIVT